MTNSQRYSGRHVKIVSYSHLADQQIDIVSHFLTAFLDLPGIEPPRSARLNQSLSVLETELIRALNTIHLCRGGELTPALRSWFLANKKGLVPEFVEAAMRDSLDTIRLDETKPPWVAAQQDLISRYAPSIVPPHHLDGLHERRSTDASFVRQDYLLEPSVANALNDIYETYCHTQQPAA